MDLYAQWLVGSDCEKLGSIRNNNITDIDTSICLLRKPMQEWTALTNKIISIRFSACSETSFQKALIFTFLPKIVNKVILRSNKNDQFSRYQISCLVRSCFSSSVDVGPRQPFTCAHPVIPGRR